MSSSTKIGNRKKDELITGKGPTQRLEHTLSAEKVHSISFTENNKKVCLSLHYNGADSYLLMVQKFINLKQSILNLQQVHYVQETFHQSRKQDWTVDNMKKTELNRYVYDFSADYDAIAVDDILEIHKYLMKKKNMI